MEISTFFENSNKEWMSCYLSLTPDPATNVSIIADDRYVEFSNVTLRCQSDGTNLSYQWLEGAFPLDSTSRSYELSNGGRTLLLPNLSRDGRGTFTCRVENPVSHANSSITLEPLCKCYFLFCLPNECVEGIYWNITKLHTWLQTKSSILLKWLWIVCCIFAALIFVNIAQLC